MATANTICQSFQEYSFLITQALEQFNRAIFVFMFPRDQIDLDFHIGAVDLIYVKI